MDELDSITTLKGIGEKTAVIYGKLGIQTIGDLLNYLPRSYDEYKEPISIRECALVDFAAVECAFVTSPALITVGSMKIVNVTAEDREGNRIRCTWYGMPYLKNTLKTGSRYVVRGRLAQSGKTRFFSQPELLSPAAYGEKQKSLQPVYPLTSGITVNGISKAVRTVFESGLTPKETLPAHVVARYGLMNRAEAVHASHFPKNKDELRTAHHRLAFEEFYRFLIGVRHMKENFASTPNPCAIERKPEVDAFLKALPYELTGAQKRVFEEIEQNLTGPTLMHRMVQGDVGSGKTILAFLGMLDAALSGYQSALMAPTEVLARQHYEKICAMIETYQLPVTAVLLTGSLKASEKKAVKQSIAAHEADLIIGTHALIQDSVDYAKIALVITDEQHRFGVRQRDALAAKGSSVHVLVMSATPIPRSLAMILYGDLDMSIIDELPASRLPIKNAVVDVSWREKGWNFIRSQVGEGRQAYVICPLIEPSEGYEGEDVTGYASKLQKYLGNQITVGLLHGKMPDAKKEAVMAAFGRNEIQVLVSTTVVEVGIDVPNATVIMIENADRFGLAQLHQLRGRVGRGKDQSYCILMDTSGKAEAHERLELLSRTRDGFALAKEDLRMRGPGEFFGVRQSGELAFRIADIYADASVLKEASEAVEEYINSEADASGKEQHGI